MFDWPWAIGFSEAPLQFHSQCGYPEGGRGAGVAGFKIDAYIHGHNIKRCDPPLPYLVYTSLIP